MSALRANPPEPLVSALPPDAPPEPLKGLDAVLFSVLGRIGSLRWTPGRFLRAADRVLAHEQRLAGLSEAALTEETLAARERVRRGGAAHDHEAALGVIREAARRETGLLAYREQVAGSLALQRGAIAEMATGEGKTLTAVLGAALCAWGPGGSAGVHVVTANDYLARRDAEFASGALSRLGLRSGFVVQGSLEAERRGAYRSDVTYATHKELAADFLRDRLGHAGGALMRPRAPLNRAIVDEADFVLIDDAVTPLILSAPAAPDSALVGDVLTAREIAGALDEGRDYRVDERLRECTLTERGSDRVARLVFERGLGGAWSGRRRREELVRTALEARRLFRNGREYVVMGEKPVIIDESTGRLMPDRTWRYGVQQAVEAQESLPISGATGTEARITFQRFFRLYRRLSGMTGTAREARGELWGVYRAPVVPIPTHRRCVRVREPDRLLPDAPSKWAAAAEAAREAAAAGRAVLIGVRSVGESESASAALRALSIPHSVLNAVHHEGEAALIARAGRAGSVTVATNMAGRGTDIVLDDACRRAGGLLVIIAGANDGARIDRQFEGRAARQGDPGGVVRLLSPTDELFRRHAGPVASFALSVWPGLSVGLAQARATRLARRSRRDLLLHDDWLNDHLGFAPER